jgi:hypothetical protein
LASPSQDAAQAGAVVRRIAIDIRRMWQSRYHVPDESPA